MKDNLLATCQCGGTIVERNIYEELACNRCDTWYDRYSYTEQEYKDMVRELKAENKKLKEELQGIKDCAEALKVILGLDK